MIPEVAQVRKQHSSLLGTDGQELHIPWLSFFLFSVLSGCGGELRVDRE